MGKERDNFWRLEQANGRKTVELVVIFILVYGLVGRALVSDLSQFSCSQP